MSEELNKGDAAFNALARARSRNSKFRNQTTPKRRPRFGRSEEIRSGAHPDQRDPQFLTNVMKKFVKDITPPSKEQKAKIEEKQMKMEEMKDPEAYRKNKAMYDVSTEVKKFDENYKKGGMVKSSASKRADGIATKGKTKGKIC